MTRQVNLYEAKTQLSQLVEDAARGEEIIIAKNGKPMAKLVVVGAVEEVKPKKRELGQWAKYMTPEERAYIGSEQFLIDSEKWDEEILRDFNVFQDTPREYDSAWPATSSTRTPSSGLKARRKRSGKKRGKR
jgi:prevent-host-death family protein